MSSNYFYSDYSDMNDIASAIDDAMSALREAESVVSNFEDVDIDDIVSEKVGDQIEEVRDQYKELYESAFAATNSVVKNTEDEIDTNVAIKLFNVITWLFDNASSDPYRSKYHVLSGIEQTLREYKDKRFEELQAAEAAKSAPDTAAYKW